MASQLGKGNSIGLAKRLWHELPEIVGSSALALFGLVGVGVVYFYRQRTGEFDIKRYRMEYTVVRPDDPLAKHAPPKEEK